MSAIRTVAFIGLGQMGRPMAANLEKAGFTLRSHKHELYGICNQPDCEPGDTLIKPD